MKASAWAGKFPWSIFIAAVLLIGLGWLGIARVEELTGGSGRILHQQVAYSAIAVVLMLLAAAPNYRILCRFSYPLYFFALLLLVIVFRFPAINDAHRWIRLGPLGFQPSELAKPAFILALARYLMYRENFRRLRGLAAPLMLTLAPVLLIFMGPDLGTALVFLPVFLIMLFAAGAKRSDLICMVAAGLLAMPLLWTQMNVDQKSRVATLLDQPAPGRIPGKHAYQLYQGKQVRAMGGVWGSFFTGQPTDDPAAYHLPEARSDFIFCILGERFGLPGMVLTLALFGWIVCRGLAIAAETREPFGRLLAVGVAA
ncbi:MAG: FtsW/RodA/SpoVE family cell cycle protein, partial [Planctomycetes bacterium]|nr:FtsW/RodA/SpoVE family cell cycle protein [Planctomycetota bacterium]